MLRALCLLIAFIPAAAGAAVSLQAPPTASAGAAIEFTVTGSQNPRDFATIVPKGAAAGSYGDYVYLDAPGRRQLAAPTTPGEFELRVLGADSPHPTLARAPLLVRAASATLEAPAQVGAGQPIRVRWTGPNNERDYIAIGDARRPYITFDYTRNANPLQLVAPDEPGEYELRYFLGAGDVVIARQKIVVGAVSATVSALAQVAAGASVDVSWTGPNNPGDFVTLVKAGAPERQYGPFAYTSQGSTLKLRAPDEPGDYELRYATGQTFATLARAPLKVGAVTGSVSGPAQAVAGSTVDVRWTGPSNASDYVSIVRRGAPDSEVGEFAYVAGGNPARIVAPLVPGDYEIRYQLGQSHGTLARAPLKIVPGAQEPGFVAMAASTAPPADRSVAVILDASGSMLQKLGAQRRIEIARQTLAKLATTTLPAGTPFALRVFGREVNSCRTDLVQPLAPLNPASAAKAIGALDAKNEARTAIGASLDAAIADLRGASGERVVVVITDGEETCAGDPPAAVRRLVQSAPRTVVHFVGFAIGDAKLAASFRQWAALGNGSYFDARDAVALDRALTQAMQPGFEVVDAAGKVVARGRAGGEPVRVSAGSYSVRIVGSAAAPRPIVVKPKETVQL
jgi:hypothetical protein